MIVVNCASHSRPRSTDRQQAFGFRLFNFRASCWIQDFKIHSIEREGARSRLHGRFPGLWGAHWPSSFSLPPGVDDAALPSADHIMEPLPRIVVDGFARDPQHSQGRTIVLLHILISLLHE